MSSQNKSDNLGEVTVSESGVANSTMAKSQVLIKNEAAFGMFTKVQAGREVS